MDRTKYLSLDEVKRLRESTMGLAALDLQHGRQQGPLAWMVVDLALSTGLRVSEIAALTLRDVDSKRLTITVTRVKKKLRKPESLAVDKALLDHITEYMANQRKPDAGDQLLVGKQGPLTAQGLQRVWKSAVKRAGLPKELSIHCGRHTLATHLLAKTHNLRQVQKQLGHSSPTVTANMYADITDENIRSGVSGVYDPPPPA